MQKNKKIDIGLAVRQKMSEQGTTIAWLAKKVNIDRSNLRKHLYKEQIYSELLLEISVAMKTNFFNIYSDCYSKRVDKINEQ